MVGLNTNQFQRLHMNDILVSEELLFFNFQVNDKNVADENIFVEIVRQSEQKYYRTVNFMVYNNHICYVNNSIAVFKPLYCPDFDTPLFLPDQVNWSNSQEHRNVNQNWDFLSD